MAWFKKTRKPIASTAEKSSRVPEGLWIKCPGCTQIIYNKDLDKNQQVCPTCAHHFRISAADRLPVPELLWSAPPRVPRQPRPEGSPPVRRSRRPGP